MFYALGHFAPFLTVGGRVLEVEAGAAPRAVDVTAALNPDTSVAVVILNRWEAPLGGRRPWVEGALGWQAPLGGMFALGGERHRAWEAP